MPSWYAESKVTLVLVGVKIWAYPVKLSQYSMSPGRRMIGMRWPVMALNVLMSPSPLSNSWCSALIALARLNPLSRYLTTRPWRASEVASMTVLYLPLAAPAQSLPGIFDEQIG